MTKDGRAVGGDELLAIAEICGFPLPLSENLHAEPQFIPLVGRSKAGDVVTLDGVAGAVRSLPGSTDITRAVKIQGLVLGPVLEGWLAYFEDSKSNAPKTYFGRLCIVGMPDNSLALKQVEKGALRGRCTLRSNFAAPLYDAEISWAAPIWALLPS